MLSILIALAFQDVGKEAPNFVLQNQDGKEVKLSAFRDKKHVLIAFYPKDATPG